MLNLLINEEQKSTLSSTNSASPLRHLTIYEERNEGQENNGIIYGK